MKENDPGPRSSGYLEEDLLARLRFGEEEPHFSARLRDLPCIDASSERSSTQAPWRLRLGLLLESGSSSRYRLWAELQSDQHPHPLDLLEVTDLSTEGTFIWEGKEEHFAPASLGYLAEVLLLGGPIEVSEDEVPQLIFEISTHFGQVDFVLSSRFHLVFETSVPSTALFLTQSPKSLPRVPSEGAASSDDTVHRALSGQSVFGHLWFRYGEREVPAFEEGEQTPLATRLETSSAGMIRIALRHIESEELAWEALRKSGGIYQVFGLNWKIPLRTDRLEALLLKGWDLWAENLKISLLDSIEIHSLKKENWFEIELRDRKRKVTLPAWQVVHLLKKKNRFIPLGDGSIGLLPSQWIERVKQLESWGQVDGERFRVSPAVHFWMKDLAGSEEGFSVWLKRELDHLKTPSISLSPGGFRGTLKPFQATGGRWLEFLYRVRLGGILADDMGLGKTVQLLAFLLLRKEQAGDERPPGACLLTVPKSVIGQWLKEAKRFTPELRVRTLSRSDLGSWDTVQNSADVLICPHGLLRSAAESLVGDVLDLLIIDEAQMFKNPATLLHQAAQSIDARCRIGMTGTPIENHTRDLLALLDLLNPGLLAPAWAAALASGDLERSKLEKLIETLAPLCLRRTKDEVLPDLPSKSEETLFIDMEPQQRARYEDLHRHYKEAISRSWDLPSNQNLFLEGLLRLRQSAIHSSLVSPGGVGSSSKFTALKKALSERVRLGRKSVVFSQFTSVLSLFGEELDALNIEFSRLDGQTIERQAVVEAFQSFETCLVLLASLKVGGVGLNLTQADTVFLLDPWWNRAVENQAIDRIHRIGQLRQVKVFRFISRGTVEERMHALQQRKAELFSLIKPTDEAFLNRLSPQDFDFLFG